MSNANDMPKVTLEQFKRLVKQSWRNRKKYRLKPFYLSGFHGIGKTESIHQLATELAEETGEQFEVKTLITSVLESPDLNGMCQIKDNVTTYAQPSFFPKKGNVILFLDEASRAPRDIQQGMLSLLDRSAINEHQLSPDAIIVLAGNPKTEKSSGPQYNVVDFDSALQDRCAYLNLVPNRKDTINYLKNKYGASNKVIQWLLTDPEVLCFDGGKSTTPRSIEHLIKALDTFKDEDVHLVAASQIGNQAAIAFSQFLSTPHILKLEHLLNITPEVSEIIQATQLEASELGTLNHWSSMFLEHLKAEGKRLDNTDFIDLVKHKDLLNKTVDFMLQMNSYDWLVHFMNELSNVFEQQTDNVEKQLTALRDAKPDAYKKQMRKALENETTKTQQI